MGLERERTRFEMHAWVLNQAYLFQKRTLKYLGTLRFTVYLEDLYLKNFLKFGPSLTGFCVCQCETDC